VVLLGATSIPSIPRHFPRSTADLLTRMGFQTWINQGAGNGARWVQRRANKEPVDKGGLETSS